MVEECLRYYITAAFFEPALPSFRTTLLLVFSELKVALTLSCYFPAAKLIPPI